MAITPGPGYQVDPKNSNAVIPIGGASQDAPKSLADIQTKAANQGKPGYDALGDPIQSQPINRPILTPPNTSGTMAPSMPTVPAPRSADDIYATYVNQGKDTLDRINSIYDSAISRANTAIDAPAAKEQADRNAAAAASGLLGSSAAIAGSAKVARDAGDKKATAASDIRGQQAQQVTSYLTQLQQAAQTQANTEATRFPTLDAYYKSQAGTAFQGLATAGMDWDKFAASPQYADTYNSIINTFGGDPNLAKLAFIAAGKGGTQSAYLNQDPIQSADGSWIFLKQTTGPDGTTTITPDKVDVGKYLAPGESLTTLGGKPYAVTKADDGTLTYKPIDPTPDATKTPAGFTIGSNESRYEFNPTTGAFEQVAAKGPAPKAPGDPANTTDQLYDGLSAHTSTAVRARVAKYGTDQTIQNFSTVQDGYNFANSLNTDTKNPADDQALIYSLAKALDPGSVVREGEYATAQKYAQSWIDAYGKGISQALLGTGFLSKTARDNIKKTITEKYTSQKRSYDQTRKSYIQGIDALTGRDDGDSFLVEYQTPDVDSGDSNFGSELSGDGRVDPMGIF